MLVILYSKSKWKKLRKDNVLEDNAAVDECVCVCVCVHLRWWI